MPHNPLETEIQASVIEWCNLHPKANTIFAIPNGTHIKSHQGRAKAKREGLKAGVPDLFLPYPLMSGNEMVYGGLFIEMKRKGGKVSEDQKEWICRLDASGYKAVVCYSFDEAINTIQEYLDG